MIVAAITSNVELADAPGNVRSVDAIQRKRETDPIMAERIVRMRDGVLAS